MKRFLVVILAACVLVVSMGSSVSAAEQSLPKVPGPIITQEMIDRFDPAVMFTEADGYTLAVVPKGATAADVKAVKEQLAIANEFRTAMKKAAAHEPGKYSFDDAKAGVFRQIGLTDAGQNKTVHYWYGFDWYISNDRTEQLAYGLRTAGNAMVILALIVAWLPPWGTAAAVALAIATALFAWGADTLDYVNQGRGVIIMIRYGIPTGMRAQ